MGSFFLDNARPYMDACATLTLGQRRLLRSLILQWQGGGTLMHQLVPSSKCIFFIQIIFVSGNGMVQSRAIFPQLTLKDKT